MRAIVQAGGWPAPGQPWGIPFLPHDERQEGVRQRVPQAAGVHLPAVPPLRRHDDPHALYDRRVGLPIAGLVHVVGIGRRDPSAVDEHGGPVGEAQRGDERHAGGAVEAPARPDAFAGEVVDPARDDASLIGRVGRNAAPRELDRGKGEAGWESQISGDPRE